MITTEEYAFLEEYTRWEGTEIGSYVSALLDMRDQFDESYGMTREFDASLNKELEYWVFRFKCETELVEHTEPQQDRVYKEVVWYNVDYTAVEEGV